jgi:LPS sulfotransferase NodH
MLTRLDDGKCARRLLHYLAPLRGCDVEITIAGRGARRWEIQRDLTANPLASRVRFIGPIPSRDVPGFLAAADIGLHLTETDEETCSVAVLEMLAAGLPVVSQPRGSLTMLVDDGVNGALAEREADVGDRLLALARSRDDRVRTSAAARRRAESYDLPRFAARWRALVERCRDAYVRRGEGGRAGAGARRQTAPAIAAIAAAVRRAPARQPPAFLIASTRRAGASLLAAALESTGAIGVLAYDVARWRQRLHGRSWRHATFDAYLDARWTRHASPRGVYGVRLAYDDLEYLAATHGTIEWPARWLGRFGGAAWVRMRRRDRVAQAISWSLAEQTGIWAGPGATAGACVPPEYERDRIAACLHRLEDEDRAWDRFVAACGAEPIDVIYEDLARDIGSATMRVLRAIGVPPPDPFYCRADVERQADATSREWADRYARGE